MDSLRETAGRAAEAGSPSLFIVAGEASGDWAGALLARALRERRADLALRGVGGRRMAAAGVELLADSSDWGAIGVLDAVRKIPRVWRALRSVRAHLARDRPSGLVLIDAGGVNIPLARMVRPLGVRTLYYLPPGSWSRRLRNAGLRELVDVIATPFAWSRDLLAGGSARVEWVGHPVVEAARPRLTAEEAWEQYDLDAALPVVAMAPGSREQEMRYVLPVLAEGAAILAREWEGVQFLVPVAEPDYEMDARHAFDRFGLKVRLLRGMEYDALQLARAAAVCSGTATLEFACLGIPMVVVYRASPATTVQYLLVRGVVSGQWRAAMPNIIAGRDVVPELMWRYARPEAIAREVGSLLADGEHRERMRAELAEVVRSLGPAGASARTAELVLELIGRGEGGR
jgi:lipid-A-disaccharide synthase